MVRPTSPPKCRCGITCKWLGGTSRWRLEELVQLIMGILFGRILSPAPQIADWRRLTKLDRRLPFPSQRGMRDQVTLCLQMHIGWNGTLETDKHPPTVANRRVRTFSYCCLSYGLQPSVHKLHTRSASLSAQEGPQASHRRDPRPNIIPKHEIKFVSIGRVGERLQGSRPMNQAFAPNTGPVARPVPFRTGWCVLCLVPWLVDPTDLTADFVCRTAQRSFEVPRSMYTEAKSRILRPSQQGYRLVADGTYTSATKLCRWPLPQSPAYFLTAARIGSCRAHLFASPRSVVADQPSLASLQQKPNIITPCR